MLRHLFCGAMVAVLALVAGCDTPATTPAAAPSPAVAPSPPLPPSPPGGLAPTPTNAPEQPTVTPSAASNTAAPAAWSQQQTEAWVKHVYKLEELSITETGPKKYKGTGKSADGTNYTFSLIEELPTTIKCVASSDQGASGTMNLSKSILTKSN